jgi:hypothetical protein
MNPEELSDEELDDIFFQMAMCSNIDLLDEMIKDMKNKPILTKDEEAKLVEDQKKLSDLLKMKKEKYKNID